MTTEAGVPLEEVKQLLTDATQQLAQTLDTINDIIEEAGQASDDSTSEPDSVPAQQCQGIESEPDDDTGEEEMLVPSTSRTTLWIAGAGITAVAVGAGVYLYTQTDLFEDGFSFSAIRNRAYNMVADKANQTRTEIGIDNDDGIVDDDNMTLLERIGHAATFAANLVLSSVVTSIGEKARTYLNVESYVESAHERLMEAVKEPLESIQNAVEEQVQAVQDAVEDQVQAAKDAVQDQIASVQDDIAARVKDVTGAVTDQMENVVGGLSEQMEGVMDNVTNQMDNVVNGVADQVQDVIGNAGVATECTETTADSDESDQE